MSQLQAYVCLLFILQLILEKKIFSESLEIVNEATAEALHMKPGQKLCSTCVKRYKKGDINDTDDGANKEDKDYEPSTFTKEALDTGASSFGCSPIKTHVQKRDKVRYGKRKVEAIQNAAQEKVAKVLKVPPKAITLPQKKEPCRKCDDCDRLVQLLKEKYVNATKNEKVKLLTLLPHSWKRKRIMDEFPMSMSMYKKAKHLKREKGRIGI